MNIFFEFEKIWVEKLLKFNIANEKFMILQTAINGFDYPIEENCKDYTKIFVIKDNPLNKSKRKYYVLIFLFDKYTHQPIELNDKLSERYNCKNKSGNKTYCEKKCLLKQNNLFSTYSLNGKNFIYFTRTLEEFNKGNSNKITIANDDVFLDPVESKDKLNEELDKIVNPQPKSTNVSNLPVNNLRTKLSSSTNLTTPNNATRQSNSTVNLSNSTVNSSAPTENLSKSTAQTSNNRINILQELEVIWMKPINVTLDVKIKLENKNHSNKNKKEKALQFIINAIKEQNPQIYIFLLKCNLLDKKNIKIQLNYLVSKNININEKLTINVLTKNILNGVIFIIDNIQIKYKELEDLLKENKNLTFNRLKNFNNLKKKIEIHQINTSNRSYENVNNPLGTRQLTQPNLTLNKTLNTPKPKKPTSLLSRFKIF
jgi:hypothetical protein